MSHLREVTHGTAADDAPAEYAPSDVRRLQEAVFREGFDYITGSPHLADGHLHQRIVGWLRGAADASERADLPREWLDVGAGHGGFVEPALSWGWRVTATDMSAPSVDYLNAWYGANPQFEALVDADGSSSILDARRFAVVSVVGVLHHVPDYLTMIDGLVREHLLPGGTFVTFQDPMWYPRMGKWRTAASRGAYFAWRLSRGNYRAGLRTRLRRLRGMYDESEVSDMVEFHVVRRGVDEAAIRDRLLPRFEDVAIVPYWSSQGSLWQRFGEYLGLKNTFGIIATGYRDLRMPTGGNP